MPRLRLWMLLLAVMVLACGLGGYREWQVQAWGARYRRQAVFHAAAESNLRMTLDVLNRDDAPFAAERPGVVGRFYLGLSRRSGSKDLLTPWDYGRHPLDLSGLGFPELDGGWASPVYHAKYTAACRRLMAYHGLMRRKYERAASRPWEALAPDPPAPTLPSSTMPSRARRPFPRPPVSVPGGSPQGRPGRPDS